MEQYSLHATGNDVNWLLTTPLLCENAQCNNRRLDRADSSHAGFVIVRNLLMLHHGRINHMNWRHNNSSSDVLSVSVHCVRSLTVCRALIMQRQWTATDASTTTTTMILTSCYRSDGGIIGGANAVKEPRHFEVLQPAHPDALFPRKKLTIFL